MKRIVTMSGALLILAAAQGQQKEGKVTYERTVQMQISFTGMTEEMQRMIPKSRTDKFELTFGNNQSLWKQAETEPDRDEMAGGESGGMIVRVATAGGSDVVFSDFNTGRRVEKRDLMDKTFIIDDSVKALKWKMTGETKTILNHNCMKATATNIVTRPSTVMNDGKVERKEVIDTAVVIAWFTSDIPVPAGPAEFQGQLPGLILEMDISNGRMVYKATAIDTRADLATIKEPTGKKRYTRAEFNKERDKAMEGMRMGNGGGRRVIMNN